MMNTKTKTLLTALTAGAVLALSTNGGAIAAPLVDVDFEDATNGYMENLVHYDTPLANNSNFPNTIGVGATGSNAYTAGNIAVKNDTAVAIGTETFFSVDAKHRANDRTSQAGLAFGWTTVSGAINAYNGLDFEDTVGVGITRTGAASTYVLSRGNDVASFGTGIGFAGGSSTTLVVGNWYRLSGTILFDADTSTFSFNNIELSDLGTDGTSTPGPALLSGSDTFAADDTFWNDTTTGRVYVTGNDRRGFSTIDNVLIDVVPEPSSLALLGLGGLLIARRRRG